MLKQTTLLEYENIQPKRQESIRGDPNKGTQTNRFEGQLSILERGRKKKTRSKERTQNRYKKGQIKKTDRATRKSSCIRDRG